MDRRHPHVSVDDLRRHLLEADADRFRLRRTLAEHAAQPQRIRRAAAAMAAVLAIAAVGGVAWQMCTRPARAEAAQATPAPLRVATMSVHPTVIVGEPRRPAARAGAVVRKLRAPMRASRGPHTATIAVATRRPRPLSPGEFGRRSSSPSNP